MLIRDARHLGREKEFHVPHAGICRLTARPPARGNWTSPAPPAGMRVNNDYEFRIVKFRAFPVTITPIVPYLSGFNVEV